MRTRRLLSFILLGSWIAIGPAQADWTIDDALNLDRVSLEIRHRTRYEFLDDPFRPANAGKSASDVVVQRTLLHARVRALPTWTIGAELMDSRAHRNRDTVLNSTIVNPVELLQAYAEFRKKAVHGGELLARAGRITMDVGSRRFVARNRYRNTINGFTGLDVDWHGNRDRGATHIRAFFTLPVQREPNPQSASARRNRYRDNDIVFDTESFDVLFWGLFAARSFDVILPGDDVAHRVRAEAFLFGLHESDARSRPTRNRQLYTPGFRLFSEPTPGQADATLEAALQFGQSRSGSSSTRELGHLAWFLHTTLGYTFDAPASPRLAFQLDYASGDGDPDDGQNGRFDTLFGARRFDFGPTGIYGPFARSNLITPGLRLQLKPHSRVTSFLAVRTFWLASKSDAWTTTGIGDNTGSSGDHLGTQLEIRVRWDICPKNVRLEAGYAHLFPGEFIDDAPTSNRQGDSNYFYTQVSFHF